jgi:hypothetical protein
MAKKAPKKSIEKKSFNLDDFKAANGMDQKVKKKELSWIPLSDSFHEALRIPGIPRGFFTSFRGYSNTGKSTAVYEGVVGCQQIGDLPVIIETEGNWSWEHARNIGMEFEEYIDDDGTKNYKGDFIFFSGEALLKRYGTVDYSNGTTKTKPLRNEPIIEDVARVMEELLDAQEEGNLPRNLCFFWDSVGSLNGFKSVMSKSNNNQWNAGSQEAAFKAIVSHRIPKSQTEGEEFTNTFVVVQKIWMDNENKKIKHKGGESFFYSPRIIVHFGGILSHATKKLKATSQKEEFQFGIETKVSCEKNQVNGIEQKGKIASTPHGYWNPDKIEDYKKQHKDFIIENLSKGIEDFNYNTEIEIVTEDGEFSDDDLTANAKRSGK